MNFTAIIAILELKGIITREEGEKVIEFLNNKPQSTLLADAVDQVKELVDKELPALFAKVEAKAKTEAKKVADKAVDEAAKVAGEVAGQAADKAVETAKTEAEKVATDAAETAVSDAAKAAEETAKPQPKAEALKNKA